MASDQEEKPSRRLNSKQKFFLMVATIQGTEFLIQKLYALHLLMNPKKFVDKMKIYLIKYQSFVLRFFFC